MPAKTVGVAFITHYARHHLTHCLPPILASPLKPRVLVVNSSSKDGTIEEAERIGAEVLVVPRDQFNHGTTRELARKHLSTDIVVMMTPDAYAQDATMLEKLIQPIQDGLAAASYARQLPHHGADFLEAFPRTFNYPPQSQLRSLHDLATTGVYTFFCSDVCAAWDNHRLDKIGGFRHVLTGEDTLASAMLLHQGHRIAYVAEAVVRHSHAYTAMQEFRRYFDTGYARHQAPLLREFMRNAGNDERRGKEFMRAIFKASMKNRPRLLPKLGIHLFAKWLGYQLGKSSLHAPAWLKKRMSAQDYYWDNP
jgi:rhamnosyltransferase